MYLRLYCYEYWVEKGKQKLIGFAGSPQSLEKIHGGGDDGVEVGREGKGK